MDKSEKNKSLTAKRSINNDQYFQLLNIYLTEWCHRDEFMQKEIHTYFYAALIVILAPYIELLKITITITEELKLICFCAGMVLAICVLMSGFLYAKRLSNVGDQYRELLKLLPKDYRKVYFIEKDRTEKSARTTYLSYIIPIIMTLCLVVLNLLLYIICR